MSARLITIGRDPDDYADEAERAWRDYDGTEGAASSRGGKAVPAAVMERVLSDIRDGHVSHIPGDGRPRELFETVAANADFGPIESVWGGVVLRYALPAAERLCAERGASLPHDESARKRFFRENAPEIMGLWGGLSLGGEAFWYEDRKSEYGVGVCVSTGLTPKPYHKKAERGGG